MRNGQLISGSSLSIIIDMMFELEHIGNHAIDAAKTLFEVSQFLDDSPKSEHR